jgi:hypothetical protein
VEQIAIERLPAGSYEENLKQTTDNGTQFTSSRFFETLARLGITIGGRRIITRKATTNVPMIGLLHWFSVKGIVYSQNESRFLCTHTLVVGCRFFEEERPFSSQHSLDAFAKSSNCSIVIKVYLHQIK